MGCASSHTLANNARGKFNQIRKHEASSSPSSTAQTNNNNRDNSLDTNDKDCDSNKNLHNSESELERRIASSQVASASNNNDDDNDGYFDNKSNVSESNDLKQRHQLTRQDKASGEAQNNNFSDANNNNENTMTKTTTTNDVNNATTHINSPSARSLTDDDNGNNSVVNDEQLINYGESGTLSPFDLQTNGELDNDQIDPNNVDNGDNDNNLMLNDQQDQVSHGNQNGWNMDININLLNEYIQIDYEISQIESKDVLNMYHESIEQLEQIDQELDFTSKEIEKLTQRQQLSMITSSDREGSLRSVSIRHNRGSKRNSSTMISHSDAMSINIEEMFAKKILLEKERDKLKQELEKVILECDILQQRYKKRDALLDEIFDGHFGSGLENHLEKQLDWLLEQKQYVDQVFYAWKRAETLATQACEQFSRALDEFSKIERQTNLTKDELDEVAKGVHELCVKSRLDMEKAQKYNPNVDAPFYTDNETDNFNNVIETILSGDWNQLKKNKVKTTIEVAYKRALSIRQWLGQILQTTIARDSFELAEEYRWIAVQLRKERINLIKARVQESPHIATFAATSNLHAQLRTMQQSESGHHEINNNNNNNRDSGVESENNDLDLEEEIAQMLKKNRQQHQQQQQIESTSDKSVSKPNAPLKYSQGAFSGNNGRRPASLDANIGNSKFAIAKASMDNIQQTAAKLTNGYKPERADMALGSKTGSIKSEAPSLRTATSISMDEETKKSLIAQIDKLHEKRRRQLEQHQKKNQAKISDAIKNRIERRQKLKQETIIKPRQLST